MDKQRSTITISERRSGRATPSRLAVVTGASSGIGLELARTFLSHDFDVVVVAENDAIHEVPSALQTNGVQEILPVQVDLAAVDGADILYQQLRALGRPVHALALNAGVGVGGPFLENSIEAEMNLIALNISSLVRLSKLVLPDMVAQGEGRVLFTSSIAALTPGPYYAVYAASKAFVHSFSEALRYELRDTGVTVTALQPGATDTNFFARAGMLDTKAGRSDKDPPADVANDGFDALMAGRDHVVAGSIKNRMQALISEITPEPMKAAQHAKLTEPGSGVEEKD
ncbi:MAG: SDR family NAD(P)-dependent oxidoreductase [Gemmatimonadaceae bacterium]|nr:SDR family NAD(P)-dependent oxidoreductase [Gemmatimonadaceae bacterium]